MRSRALFAALIACSALAACDLFKKEKPTEPIDSALTGFPVATTADDDYGASGAGLAGHYLVSMVTTSPISGSTASLQLISETGLLGSPMIVGSNEGDLGLVANDGTKYLAVTQIGQNSANLWGQFVGSDGVMSGAAFQITTTNDDPVVYSLTYGAGTYLVTYGRSAFDATAGANVFQAYARTISTSGVVGTEMNIGNAGQISAADFDGANFFVITPQNGASAQLKGRTISTAGALGSSNSLTAAGINVSVPTAIAWNGTNHLVAWGHRTTGTQFADTIWVGLFTSAGASVSTPQSLPLANRIASVQSVVATSDGFVVVWIEKNGSALTTQAQHVTFGGGLSGAPVTLYAPSGTVESAVAYLIGPVTSKVMALINRKIGGKYDLYAEVISVP